MSKVICPEPGSQLIIGSVTFGPHEGSTAVRKPGWGYVQPTPVDYDHRLGGYPAGGEVLCPECARLRTELALARDQIANLERGLYVRSVK